MVQDRLQCYKSSLTSNHRVPTLLHYIGDNHFYYHSFNHKKRGIDFNERDDIISRPIIGYNPINPGDHIQTAMGKHEIQRLRFLTNKFSKTISKKCGYMALASAVRLILSILGCRTWVAPPSEFPSIVIFCLLKKEKKWKKKNTGTELTAPQIK